MSKKIFFVISKQNQINNTQYKISKNNDEYHLWNKNKNISFMLDISKKKFYIL